MEIVDFVDEGLGHTSFLVDLEDGRALIVDPGRIPSRQAAAAEARGLTIAFTADTHTHADYVSGSPELAARGATFLAPAAARLEVPHRGIEPAEELHLGGLTLQAISTPGHTPDHLAYLLRDGARPVALFSGGSLMVGTVGRTDLLGDEQREDLARRLYRALHENVLTLPDDLPVYPTHGAGSFCSAPGAAERVTTIGRERATNPFLDDIDEDTFVDRLLAGLGSFPTYFTQLPERNRTGPCLYGEVPALPLLSLDDTRRALRKGAVIVDARPIAAFAAGHVPGALSIELRPVFASWLGWLVELDTPLLFVLDDGQDRAELVGQALEVGHERFIGELAGGMRTWRTAGLDETRTEIIGVDALHEPIVDVRQRNEYATGHVPGAGHVELGALARADVPAGPVTLMCGHGERAMSAASVLERAGRRDVLVLVGGPTDWATATGGTLALGS